MRAPRAVFASPAATRALVDGRVGAVQVVVGAGTYLTLGEDWLFVVEPDAGLSGPLSLAVDGIPQLGLAPGMQVEVRARQLIVGGGAISLERMRERPLRPVGSEAVAGPWAISGAVDAAVAELPPVSAVLRRGVDALVDGALAEAAALLAGVGDGLTPAGDDVLAGYAGWQAACGHRAQPGGVSDHTSSLSVLGAGHCSRLGLAYLRCAERGELPDDAARLIDAIRRGSTDDVRGAVHGLLKWGASSGIALGRGVAAAATGGATAKSTSPGRASRATPAMAAPN